VARIRAAVLVALAAIAFTSLAPAQEGAPPPPANPAEKIAFHGEIRRQSDNGPVEGARVVVATATFGGGGGGGGRRGDARRGGRGDGRAASEAAPAFQAEGVTAADGTFSIDVPRGRYQVSVSAPGLETIVQVVRAESPATAVLRIALARGVALRGRVLGDDGAPIAGAHLLAPPVGQARSADDGSFAIEGIPVDDPSVRLIATARGRVARELPLDIASLERGEPMEVRLSSGKTIRVAVKDEKGAPVDGATVSPAGLSGWMGETIADGPGAFRFTALPPGVATRFDVSITDYPDHRATVAPASTDATVVVTKGREAAVAVLDAAGGKIPGATVTLVPADGEEATGVGAEPETAETDASGRAEFAGLAFGSYRAIATSADGARGVAAFTLAPGAPATFEAEVRLSKAPAAADAGGLPPTQIAWAADYDAAFAAARSRNRPVFVAVAMDGETANDAIAATHFRDPGFVAATRSVVPLLSNPNRHAESGPCPRYGAITCAEHRAVEERVRTEILRTENIVAPQHLVLAPNGDVIERRLFLISVGDMASLCLRGLARVDADAALALAASRIGAAGETLRTAAPGSPERLRALGDVAALAAAGDALAAVALSVARLERATPAEAAAVLDALARPGAREATDVLARLLENADATARARAAQAMTGARDGSPAFEALLARLEVEPDAAPRSAIAAALGVDLAKSTVPASGSAETRGRIVSALGRAGVEFATPLLGEDLVSGDLDRVARAAVALGRLRTPQARQLLEAHLVGTSPCRGAAARALGAQGVAASAPALRRGLGDSDPFVRAQCARALGRLHDAESAATLEKLAASDPLSLVRVEAAAALRALGAPGADDLLRALERDPHAGARAKEALAGESG